MLNREEAEKVCQGIFARSPADETEVLLVSGQGNSLRLAESGPSEQNALREVQLSLRVVRGKHHGRATASSLSEAAVGNALEAALAAAVHAPESDLPELSGPLEGDDGGHSESAARALAEHDPATKIADVEGYLARVREKGAVATGFYDTGASSTTYATSRGLLRHGYDGTASFSSTAIAGDGAGVGMSIANGTPLTKEAVEAAGDRALSKALASREPREIEAGSYKVLLEPRAVGDMLMFMAWAGLGARPYLDGRSFLSGKMGERVLDEKLSIVEAPSDPRFSACLFDLEGQQRKDLTLIEKGKATGMVYDRPTAMEAGAESTGHSGPQPSASGPFPSSLIFRGEGEIRPDLLASVDRGLLVTQFHYTNLIDPLPVTVTGMTRNGTFLIEDGKIVHAVKNLRFTQGLVEAFSKIEAFGDDESLVDAFFGGSTVCPSVLLESFRFTSCTSF